MRLQIQLGRLVSACEAVPGVYHVQDQMTGALVPVAAPQKKTWRDRWSPWHGTLAGVAVAFAAVAASGVWQWQQFKASSQTPARGPSVALPIAMTDPQSGSVRMVDAPYHDEGPLPIAPQPTPPGDERAATAPVMTIAAAPAPQFQPSMPPAVPAPAAAIVPAPAPAPTPKSAPSAERRPEVAAKLPASAPSTKPIATPPAKAAKRATPGASGAASADETVVVFNEPTHTRQPPATTPAVAAAPAPVAPTTPPQARQAALVAPTAHATPVSPSAPAAPVASAAPASKTGGSVRLVAIKDANLALVHIPGNPLPMPVKTGAKLPNGLTLVKADPAKGVVHFDNGSTLALE